MKDKLLVVKIGGNVINDEAKLSSFLKGFDSLSHPKILIHGGGKLATNLSERLGIATQITEGRRITSDEDIEVVTMVYAGLISKQITAKLQSLGCNAIGLSGGDANCIMAVKRPATPIDFGWVGDVKEVNVEAVQLFLSNGVTPVFSAICHDGNGQLLNTNADTIAADIAIAMSTQYSVELIYCFEKKGVLKDVNNENSVIDTITLDTYEQMKSNGLISDGMLPKLKNCFYAIDHNVSQVKIGDQHLLDNLESIHTTIMK
jgi:acetylglutamate kinase